MAYENPVSVREMADTMGMPCAYIEPVVDLLVRGELLGKTSGGLIYTRCFMQKYEDSFGDIAAQEAIAHNYAEAVWNIAWKHLAPLTNRQVFVQMTEKQKATLILFFINQSLGQCILNARPPFESGSDFYPERPNGGRWLATLTVYENGQNRNSLYESSGPVFVNYRPDSNSNNLCQMFDFQSVFGDAHWAYEKFKYKLSLQTILRFYASLPDCEVKPDNNMVYELIPEFEKLYILRRNESNEIVLDIPALPFDEVEIWNPVLKEMTDELNEIIGEELVKCWLTQNNKVPKQVDCRERFIHASALKAYQTAQLMSIVNKGLLPYNIEIGKTPLIYLAYKKKDGTGK